VQLRFFAIMSEFDNSEKYRFMLDLGLWFVVAAVDPKFLDTTRFVSEWCRYRFYQGLGLESRGGSTLVGGTALVRQEDESNPHCDTKSRTSPRGSQSGRRVVFFVRR
jgi:hypothetical protein